jgi:hypothetical protein
VEDFQHPFLTRRFILQLLPFPSCPPSSVVVLSFPPCTAAIARRTESFPAFALGYTNDCYLVTRDATCQLGRFQKNATYSVNFPVDIVQFGTVYSSIESPRDAYGGAGYWKHNCCQILFPDLRVALHTSCLKSKMPLGIAAVWLRRSDGGIVASSCIPCSLTIANPVAQAISRAIEAIPEVSARINAQISIAGNRQKMNNSESRRPCLSRIMVAYYLCWINIEQLQAQVVYFHRLNKGLS